MEPKASRLAGALAQSGHSFYSLVANRRKFERHALAGEIIATYTNIYNEAIRYRCSCIDWSPRGVGLVSSEPIPRDVSVRLHSDAFHGATFGRVRCCQQVGMTFRIGLEFTSNPKLEVDLSIS